MKSSAVGAIAAQGAQALASFLLQVLVAHTLGIRGLGVFAILYGVVVLASGIVTGFVGDSLVVLDRTAPPIRSALQQYAIVLSVAAGAIAAIVTAATGLVSPLEAVAFAAAIAVFCLEEVIRRTLMAGLQFWRVALIDLLGMVVALAVIGGVHLLMPLGLLSYLLALALGQAVALLLGVCILPAKERFAVGVMRGGRRAVAAYGVWRSLQQLLRPALLTGVRTAVVVTAGLAATGLLEAARVYVAPALLVVGGLSSFLFASFARERGRPVAGQLRRADRSVALLLGVTVVLGAVAVLALPVAGPALFGVSPDLRAVGGWLCYTASVAAATPYGSLASVNGRQAVVFLIRASDTVLSFAALLIALAVGMDPAWSAAVLTVGSLTGGLVLRAGVAGRGPRSPDGPRTRGFAGATSGTD